MLESLPQLATEPRRRASASATPGANPNGGWKERGRAFENRLTDGAAVGVFDPGETVGGTKNPGWIDILTGITAHKRQDGQYLVFVEEDDRAKVLLYRWKP